MLKTEGFFYNCCNHMQDCKLLILLNCSSVSSIVIDHEIDDIPSDVLCICCIIYIIVYNNIKMDQKIAIYTFKNLNNIIQKTIVYAAD